MDYECFLFENSNEIKEDNQSELWSAIEDDEFEHEPFIRIRAMQECLPPNLVGVLIYTLHLVAGGFLSSALAAVVQRLLHRQRNIALFINHH